MSEADRVLTTLDLLAENRNRSVDQLNELVGAHLLPDESSNEVFNVYVGRPQRIPFARLEVRRPRDGRNRGFILVDVAPPARQEASCVTLPDAMRRYGQFNDMHLPTDEQGPGAATSWVWLRDWGEIWLDFADDKPGCLVSASIRWPD